MATGTRRTFRVPGSALKGARARATVDALRAKVSDAGVWIDAGELLESDTRACQTTPEAGVLPRPNYAILAKEWQAPRKKVKLQNEPKFWRGASFVTSQQ